jgi:DNA-binding MarR family transcriptional regulator
MKLEDEIKQKNFENEFQKLAVNIIYTHGWLTYSQSKTFQQYGITGTQFNILRILRGQHPKPASVNLLKERMLDKQSDVSRMVERLRVKGLVERTICFNDRRKAEVLISDIGLKLLEKLDEESTEFDKAFKYITGNEAKIINDLLDKLRGDSAANNAYELDEG